jgi:hypothetical protein
MAARKRVRIKYCGGCNPHYDRTAVAGRLRTDFPQLDIVESDDYPDDQNHFVAVLCGCQAACASHANLHGLCGKMVITSEKEYAALAEAIQAILF